MKKLVLLTSSMLMALSLQGFAADTHTHDVDMKDTQMSMGEKADAEQAAKTEAEVRKVDKKQGKITLKHGDIKNLGMPGMTMVFKVKDPAMLNDIAVGDKITFIADRINGAVVVTSIEKMAK